MGKMDIDPLAILFPRGFTQVRKDTVLHSLSKDAATEKERIDIDCVPRDLVDHDTHKSIISEPITDTDRQQLRRRISAKFSDLRFVSASSGEIELISAFRELRNAWELIRACRLDGDLEVEPRQKIREATRIGLGLFPLSVLQVEFGAFAIFFGHLRMIENPEMIEKAFEGSEILRQLDRDNPRTVRLHLCAFDGIVIDEDEAV